MDNLRSQGQGIQIRVKCPNKDRCGFLVNLKKNVLSISISWFDSINSFRQILLTNVGKKERNKQKTDRSGPKENILFGFRHPPTFFY
jgi:hypothetical protein